jgi:hypothetical protein
MARGGRARAVTSLAIGLGLLAAGVAALYFSTRNELLTSYKSAPTCTAFEDAMAGKDCRYTGTGTVTDISPESAGVSVYFDAPGPYSPFFRARLPLETQPNSSISVGSQVPIEFWRFRVTKFAGAATADNPVNDPRPRDLLEIGLLITALGLGASIWAIVTARDADLGAGSQLTMAATMSPIATSDALWR